MQRLSDELYPALGRERRDAGGQRARFRLITQTWAENEITAQAHLSASCLSAVLGKRLKRLFR